MVATGTFSRSVSDLQVAEASHHVLRAAHFQHVAADFVGAVADAVDHGRGRDAIREQLVGVEVDLVLPHEAADGRDFGHAGHGFELIAQIPVLKRAQVGEAVRVGAINDGVLVHPSRAGGIGADGRMHVRGQLARRSAAGIP